jgi:thimet oligopeptidase
MKYIVDVSRACYDPPSMKKAILIMATILGGCAGKTTGPEASASPSMAAVGPVWTSSVAVQGFCDANVNEAKALRAKITAVKSPSIDTVLLSFNDMLLAIDKAYGLTGLIAQVHPEKDRREAAEKCEREVQKFISDVNLDRGLYDAVSGVDISSADAHTKRFVMKLLRDFKRAGVDKDEASRKRLKEIHAKLVEVGQTFSRNIRDDVRTLELDNVDALKGLPEDWIKAHKPNDAGKIVITTNYPDYFPVQKYAQDESLRRELTKKFLSRGYPKNDATFKEILNLRQETASLLGFENWADYNAGDKMVGNAKAIEKFIADITAIAKPRGERDVAELLVRKKKDNAQALAIQTWDRFYYVGKVREEKYGFDAQTVRPYFEFSRVTKGIMDLYGDLFGVKFVRNNERPVWHRSVRAYDLYSGEKKIAEFFLDMHPREGKYKHAAMFPLRTGVQGGELPSASLVCNFPEPSETGEPALMEHTQVVTYFHEFGHLVHQLLANGSKWANLAGINVEWDFVEAPSQLLEEWAWDPDVLARFAKHIETDEPISKDTVKKMRASSEFGKGAHVMRQIFYTALSYGYHAQDPKNLDLLAYQKEVQEKYMPYPYIEGTHTYAGFGHLNGYSSMYYTYQWSLVIAKDIFTKFKSAGLLDAGVAQQYRESILAPGGARDAADLVKTFLGRDSNLDAYRQWLESE